MFLRFFGLNEAPFGVTPEPRFLYPSRTHREALASLKYGLQANRGFTALIASPGLGKTTLLYTHLNDIRASARSVFLFDIDGDCSPRELIGSILRDLGITPEPTAAGMHDQLNKVLVEESLAGRTVVIVIDEAQNLSDAALETLRLLSNFETPRAKLLHIVLAGQLQLLDKLEQPSLVQLRQRITTFCRIDPLSDSETRDYIQHRLTMAGYRGEALFHNQALDLISAASHGIPRIINNLCFNALSICRALNQKQVTAGMVEEAIADFALAPAAKQASIAPPPSPAVRVAARSQTVRSLNLPYRRMMAPVAALGIFVLTIIGFSEIRRHQFQNTSEAASLNAKIVPMSAPVADERKPDHLQIQAGASTPQPFKVTVAPHQTLRDLAMQYLGEFNAKRLHEILALNPSLSDPDYLLVGQSIWLPGPPRRNMAQSELISTDPRSLP